MHTLTSHITSSYLDIAPRLHTNEYLLLAVAVAGCSYRSLLLSQYRPKLRKQAN